MKANLTENWLFLETILKHNLLQETTKPNGDHDLAFLWTVCCNKPGCSEAVSTTEESQKQSLLISLETHEMASSAGMQISYYSSEARPLASNVSCNSQWSSPDHTEAPPQALLFWLQRLFCIILNNSGQNKHISEILYNCHCLSWNFQHWPTYVK